MRSWDLTAVETPGGTRSPVVLHSDDEGRAVLVGIGPGQELGDHQVTERAWVAVVEGTVEVEADGKTVEAGPGTLFTFAPAERHSVRSALGGRVLLLLAPWPGVGHYRP